MDKVKALIDTFIKREEEELRVAEQNSQHLKEKGADPSRISMWDALTSSSKAPLKHYKVLKNLIINS